MLVSCHNVLNFEEFIKRLEMSGNFIMNTLYDILYKVITCKYVLWKNGDPYYILGINIELYICISVI